MTIALQTIGRNQDDGNTARGICTNAVLGSDAVAQRRQRQAWLRCPSGNEAMAAELTVTAEHQHGVSKVPVRAGAQSFGPPQPGHWEFGFGNTSRCTLGVRPNKTKLTGPPRPRLARKKAHTGESG